MLNLGLQLGLSPRRANKGLSYLSQALDDLNFPAGTPLLQALVEKSGAFVDNRTLRDVSGQNHHGLLSRSPCLTLNASGTNDYVGFTSAPVSGPAASFWMWAWISDTGTYQMLFSDANFTELRVNSSEQIELILTQDASPNIQCTPGFVITTGAWHSFCWTFAGGDVYLYVDNVERSHQTANLGTSPNWANLRWHNTWRLGQRTTDNFPLVGRILAPRTWNRVITADERAALQAYGDVATGLTWMAPTCEGNGVKLYDCVGTNVGTITGATEAEAWANFQDNFHHAIRYGATVFLDNTVAANKKIVIGNKHDQTEAIYITAPANATKLRNFRGSRFFEGLTTRCDATNGGAWVYDGVESAYEFGSARSSPRWKRSTQSAMLTKVQQNVAQKVVCLGTSLTAANYWPPLLGSWLNARKNVATMVNSGTSGRNSAYMLANLTTLVLNHNPDCVLLESATNDSDDQNVDLITTAQAKTNLNAIIDAILAARPACEISLMTMNPFSNDTGRADYANGWPRHPRFYDCCDNYRQIVRERDDPRIRLIDILPAWLALPSATFESYLSDSIHPQNTGHAAVTLPRIYEDLCGTGETALFTFQQTSLLNHDFTTGTLPSGVLFARNSVGTYFDASGNITTAAANVARFQRDSASPFTARGLLLEQQKTNYVLYSSQLDNAAWTLDNSGDGVLPTRTANYTTGPDGTTSAERIQMAYTSSGFSRIQQQVTVGGTSASYTFTLWAKTNDGTTKTVTLRIGSTTQNITVTGTWQPFTQTITTSGTTTYQIMLWSSTSSSTSADLAIAAVDVKLAPADSHIPTTSASVTREQDVLTLDVGSIPNECTIVAEYSLVSGGSLVLDNAGGYALTVTTGTKIAITTSSGTTGGSRYSINGAAVQTTGGSFIAFTAMRFKGVQARLKSLVITQAVESDSTLQTLSS